MMMVSWDQSGKTIYLACTTRALAITCIPNAKPHEKPLLSHTAAVCGWAVVVAVVVAAALVDVISSQIPRQHADRLEQTEHTAPKQVPGMESRQPTRSDLLCKAAAVPA